MGNTAELVAVTIGAALSTCDFAGVIMPANVGAKSSASAPKAYD